MPVQCTCLLCGTSFQRPPSNPGRYCSLSCSTTASNRARYGDPVARFWANIDRAGGPDACWLWIAHRFASGYGSFSVNGKNVLAHRHAWMLTHGPIGPGLDCCHHCDTRTCCRPSHLFVGPRAANNHDRDAKGRTVIARGERQGSAKLTDDAVRTIRRRLAAGDGCIAIAADYGVTPGAIHHIRAGNAWKHVR